MKGNGGCQHDEGTSCKGIPFGSLGVGVGQDVLADGFLTEVPIDQHDECERNPGRTKYVSREACVLW